MKNKVIVIALLIVGFMVSLPFKINAQCPMCKQSLVSARANGDTNVGETLNNGIMYLLAFPYALVLIFLFLYFKSVRAKNKLAANSK
ncbi:MAG: hypothetical protein ACOYMA_13320 [Bacteroidia bacterium]